MDDSYFPARGLKMDLEGGYLKSWKKDYYDTGETHNSSTLAYEALFNLKAAIPLGSRVTLIPQTWNRFMFREPLDFYRNYVGGAMYGRYTYTHMPVIGINHAYMTYDKLDITRADLRINRFKQHYLTLYGNYMLSWDKLTEGFITEQHYGFGAGYSINTIIGPIQLIAHWSDLSRRIGLYFALGFDF